MVSRNNISSYRDLLDETLASEELKNEGRLKELVKNQILQSSQVDFKEYVDEVVERRTKELSNFLAMLRSTSTDDSEKSKPSKESYGSWNVKQDTEEFRVMYREGPEGTPFHTLLVEGYVDGPVDVCLCISWETALYRKWWPQSTIPSFKITSSKCLQRVRIGEQISLVRMKVSWPLSAREAVIHYFQFDYFQDGLVVVLLNSISDSETISRSTHGFDSDRIPDVDNVVRIDVVGGFAIQKVTDTRSYFRTIANMDIKLDVVPPSFINFVSRQLIGSGFKLYKKEVASVSSGDEDFAKVLKDPQYEQIREALYSVGTPLKKAEADELKQMDKSDQVIEAKGIHSDDHIRKSNNEDTRLTTSEQCVVVGNNDHVRVEENNDHVRVEENNDHVRVEDNNDHLRVELNGHFRIEKQVHSDSQPRPLEKILHTEKEPRCEIEEIGEEDAEKSTHMSKDQNNQIVEKFKVIEKGNVSIRPEVENALNTLNKAIEIIRENKSNIEHNGVPNITTEKPTLEDDAAKAETIEHNNVPNITIATSNSEKNLKTGVVSTELSKKECKVTSNEPRNSIDSQSSRRSGSSSYAREANQSKVAPASPGQFIQNAGEAPHVSVNPSLDQTTAPSLEKMIAENSTSNTTINFVNEGSMITKKNKKPRFCCLYQFPKWGNSF